MKKRLLFLIPVILITIVLLGIFVIYPKMVYQKDINTIKNKISMVNNYLLNNDGNIKSIKATLSKEEVSAKRLEIEKSINKYLSALVDNVSDLNNIKIDNNFITLVDNIDDNIKSLTNEKGTITEIKNNLDSLKEFDDTNIKDENNQKISHELLNNLEIKNYDDKISEMIKFIENSLTKLNYLKKNKNTWSVKNNVLTFNKRVNFNEYKRISTDSFALIKDTIAPVITASNITITKGTKINIKDKIKCVDAVDGNMECKISGNYDINKIGIYSIKITATDLSGNTTSKIIKLTIKEKEVNKNPYYIEVIRNQNVVIIYGLDNNKEYTKIVKVFICSVGKSKTSTPTGTFKTSDKASWGWLIGNLYGQYYTRIVGSILFHSVPYTKKAKNTLEWDEYNKLGTPASKGCIRMTVKDVKWIYDNCPRGTTVKIYDGSLPSGVSKPSAMKISSNSPNKGWDPTDPDKNNPWKM